ncbi:hypothetical protein [Cryobacterium sp. Y50]|uniref:hypothetical protein n=1 Tax=Cryobacterium sp. Y50 TaxID=2048286 RepID=UPI000CE3090A|nr:hypothetical protein [Cryobacterium sp. Y50]
MTSYTVGLDLGQGQDFSALAVVERVLVLPPLISLGAFYRQPATYGDALKDELRVRHLRRWELGTPYPVIVKDVAAMMRTPPMSDAMLFIDGTGVGRAVRDMFRDEWQQDNFGCWRPVAVTVTAGHDRNGWHVPKSDLLAAIQVPLQQGNLKIAERLLLGEQLERELTAFRQTVSQSGRDSYDIARRAGEGHGDLVSALSFALFQPNTISRPDVVENTEILGRGTTW